MKKCNCLGISDWVMRIVLALVFLLEGYGKLVMGPAAFAAMFDLPVFIGWLVALGELGAGIGILAGGLVSSKQDKKGYLTRASGGIIVLVMLGAIFIARIEGFDAGFVAGLKGMRVELVIIALGLNFLLSGNSMSKCEGKCEMCKD